MKLESYFLQVPNQCVDISALHFLFIKKLVRLGYEHLLSQHLGG